jgi:hypothetical protein
MRAPLAILSFSVFLLTLSTHAGQTTVPPSRVADTWQGTLHSRNLRYVLRIARTERGTLSATFFSIDRSSDGFPVDSLTLSGSNVKFSVSQVNGTYEGTLSPDNSAGNERMSTVERGGVKLTFKRFRIEMSKHGAACLRWSGRQWISQ